MFLSPNMGLTIWDQGVDSFDHGQLSSDMQAIDRHDHSPGKGLPIGTASIQNAAITTPLLALGAVGTAQLANGAVGTAQLQNNAVTGAILADGSVTGSKIPPGTIKESHLDPNILPLGVTALWYRAPGATNLPGGGWEICDGRPWASIVNTMGPGGTALTTGNIPDSRNTFPLGAALTGTDVLPTTPPAIGQQVGSNTINLAHSHNVSAHSHTVFGHFHGISVDGFHVHTWQGGLNVHSRMNAFLSGITITDINTFQRQNTLQSLYIAGFNDGQADALASMDSAGGHSHTGATAASANTASGSTATNTDSQLGVTDIRPSALGWLFIMLVR